jgi:hypothetical protein
MYKNTSDAKGGYNPLNDESDDILGLYENDLDTPLSSSVHGDSGSDEEVDFHVAHSDDNRIKSERSDVRESVAWFKRPINAAAIPESMNFDEVESIMWRKVSLRSQKNRICQVFICLIISSTVDVHVFTIHIYFFLQ